MFVSRSDVSFRDSIHWDSWVTGAKAIASSEDGTAALSGFDRTNRSRDGAAAIPGSIGFQSVAGASVASIATFRGPVRRSKYCGSDVRHESAACWGAAGVMGTCISVSASAIVAGVTGVAGPAPGPEGGGGPGSSGGG